MPAPLERHYTLEEYFSVEESSNIKHEFFQGQILAMAGASLRHVRLTGNVFSALRNALAGSACEVFASDLRVRTPGGLYTYPDVMVVCGGVELNRHDRLDTVTNPAAILEVLSASTAAYDRGEKSRLYQAFPTLHEYLLIDQAMPFVEHHTRAGATSEWSRHEYSSPAVAMTLTSLNVRISLAEIYAGLEFSSDRTGS